jgi:ribonuclease HII
MKFGRPLQIKMEFPNYKEEQNFHDEGFRFVFGIDEAGMGPLAGPVVAAICLLKAGDYSHRANDKWFYRVRDSKTIAKHERDKLEEQILDNCEAYGIGEASVLEIDEMNIHQARFLAMRRALQKCLQQNSLHIDFLATNEVCLLVDGKFIIPNLINENIQQQAIVKGDQKVLSIAAASILAKSHRDRLLEKLSGKYPEYELQQHKGYGTQKHIAAIKKFGPSEIHRKSFLKNIIISERV